MYNTGIYQIVNIINNKRYIGSASNLINRKTAHFNNLNKNKHENNKLQRAYNKYGKENFNFEVLLYCDKENLLFYEQRAIDSYNFKKELYNICRLAGSMIGVMKGKKFTKEHCKKISKALTGYKKTSEHIKKIADKHRGKIHTEEHKRKISESNKKVSSEINKKKALHGEKNPRYGKHGKNNPQSKSIYQIDKNTNEIIKEWESGIEIHNFLHFDSSSIYKVCRKEKNHITAYGFKWEYIKK